MPDKMSSEEMIRLSKKHTMYTWAATGSVSPIPIERAEGIYFYTPEGKRYIDFNSQLMSVNIGHGNQRVIDAIKRQADELCFAMPASATAVRARTSKLLADICPGDINTFFFTNGGAESNENAIKMARQFTGRQKILSRYRSYHGATSGSMQMTGDPRRLPNEPGAIGFVKIMDPWPYNFSFGDTDEEIVKNYLIYLEEVIQYEGPDEIAALFVETITGTNGVLTPPEGYFEGVKKILDKYGILLVCDEVMAGFGRSGKLFAFEHYGIVPDMVCMAKGLTSSYLPLGAVGLSDKIADFFQDHVFMGGLTYNSHPMGLAAAEENIKVMLEEGMIENAARLESVMREEMDQLIAKHPSVKTGRCKGLFGMLDIQKNSNGDLIADYNTTPKAMIDLKNALLDNGLFTFCRWSHVMCNPPLCITEEELREAYGIIDRCLEITDQAFEG